MAFIAPTAGRVDTDIAIALARFLVKSPSRRPSPSSRRRGRAVAVAPSLAVAPHPPSPSIRHCIDHHRPSPLCSRSIPAAIAPTLAVEEPLSRPLPLRSRCTLHRPVPSPSRSHRAVPRHQGAVAPSIAIAVEETLRCPLPSRSHRANPCHQGAAVRLVVTSPHFSSHHLPSAGASASHHAVDTSCHAPLGPLVQLVKVLPLLTPPPHICGIIESSQRSGLMLI